MDEIKDKVINLYYERYTTGEIARELDITEYEVIEILRKEHLISGY